MIVQQLSVFVENKAGQLAEFIHLLARNGIDLRALSIADTRDYGILRVIVDDTDRTVELLKSEGWIHAVTPVLSVTVDDRPGSLESILGALADRNIDIEYTYAFFSRVQGRACIVLRVEDNRQAEEALTEAGIGM